MKTSKKTADASIRVLETLKFLLKNLASIQDIINHFEKIDPNSRIYTNEVILKYINTLKVFGFKFSKQKDKYIISNVFNKFDFDKDNLEAIYLLQKFSQVIPEKKVKEEIDKFLQDLEKTFSVSTLLLINNLSKFDSCMPLIDYSQYSQQIEEYEKYCLDKQKIKVTYKNTSQSETAIVVEPNEIKYNVNEIYLSVYNPISAQVQDINFNSIIKVEQLPLKSNRTNMVSSVTFRLKDRLAKVYKLHDGEKLFQLNDDESIVILNQKEDRALLLKRLLRYGEYCEVLSPKSLREEMRQLIKAALKRYGE